MKLKLLKEDCSFFHKGYVITNTFKAYFKKAQHHSEGTLLSARGLQKWKTQKSYSNNEI